MNRIMLDFVRDRRQKRKQRHANPGRDAAADIEQGPKTGTGHDCEKDDQTDGRLVLEPWMALDKAGSGAPDCASDLQFRRGLPRPNAAGGRKFLFRSCYIHHLATVVCYRRPSCWFTSISPIRHDYTSDNR